jgi:hypothetical protein
MARKLYCPLCRVPLIEIDHHGKRLLGCIECNRWCGRGSDRLVMELPEKDFEALIGALWGARQARSVRG